MFFRLNIMFIRVNIMFIMLNILFIMFLLQWYMGTGWNKEAILISKSLLNDPNPHDHGDYSHAQNGQTSSPIILFWVICIQDISLTCKIICIFTFIKCRLRTCTINKVTIACL